MNNKSKTRWTEEEVEFLRNNYKDMTDEELSLHLDRTVVSISKKRMQLNLSKLVCWTKEMDDYLLEYYGKVSVYTMSNTIGKSVTRIRERMIYLEGTSSCEIISGNMSVRDVSEIMGVHPITINKWTKNKSIPSVKVNTRYLIIESKFWKWLKNNLNKVNFMKISDEVELVVPEWFRNEIKNRKRNFSKATCNIQVPWTQYEETVAWNLFLKGCTNAEIAEELDRTVHSVRHKMLSLKKKKMNKVG